MTKLEIEIIRDLVDNSDNSYYHFFLNFWDTICAEELAIAAALAFLTTHGTSTRPATGSQMSPSMHCMVMATALNT